MKLPFYVGGSIGLTADLEVFLQNMNSLDSLRAGVQPTTAELNASNEEARRGHGMSIAIHRAEWRTYLSRRLWIFGALLLILCGLAVVQYRWIEQLGEAQSQREKANLNAFLSNLESDFDVEITRVFVAFQAPFANGDYAVRYKEWLRHAPYPNLIRGVYIAEPGRPESLPKAVIPGQPAIRSTEWQRDLLEPPQPFTAVSVSKKNAPGLVAGWQTLLGGAGEVVLASHNPIVVIDGNPAFVFPVMPGEPGARFRLVTHARGAKPFSQGAETLSIARVVGPARWAVVVLDAQYIRTTFLPRLVRLSFRDTLASDFEILVVDTNKTASSRVVFPVESASPESQFLHPDGRISLFGLRLDCFSPSSLANTMQVKNNLPGVTALSADGFSGILTQKSPTCGGLAPTPGGGAGALWEVLVRHRVGSLDQAIATFRRRNLILSGSVLLVLALGISMLVVLTERARALAEMQAEFALGVSHELRTPLTVIRLAADNLKKGMVHSAEQSHKYGEIIGAHALELSSMIEEALSLARLQSAPLMHERTLIAPGQIVKNALGNSESVLRNAGIEVELDLAADLPPVNVDVRLIQRGLENLIQNVVKYAAAGGWMAIRAAKTHRPDGERVQISVEDRGPGISLADLPHIFEPFYRARNRGVSPAPGVGLGLTLVKRVVEAHQGSVEVESSKITRFSIFLPSHPVPPDAQKAV